MIKMELDLIHRNLQDIKENIKKSSTISGRSPDDIILIGVTKTIDIERINILKNLGIKNFGENKTKELLEKYDSIKNVNWHFIGNLQTNKVKYIIDKVSLIHSVNSIKLAREINRRALAINRNIDILLEINIASEETKKGILEKDLRDFLEDLDPLKNITLKGLMCIAPFVEFSEENRNYFKKMNKLFIDIELKNKDNINMRYLSMGMTNDYQVAIEEGANMIRIGTGIFGKGNY